MRSRRRPPSTSPHVKVIEDAAKVAGVVKSAGRALEILEFFDQIQHEASVSEITSQLGYPQSSTSILLQSLTHLGYLDYDATKRTYALTLRVALLGAWLNNEPLRDGSLLRMLEEISKETGDTVQLASRNGIFAQYIHVIQARTALRFHVPQGTRRPLVWSASGFALLRNSREEEIRTLVKRTNAELMPSQLIDVRRVIENIQLLQREGYFVSRGLVTPGAGAISMPLPGGIDGEKRPLAVTVAGLLDNIQSKEEQIVGIVQAAIRRYRRSNRVSR